MSNPLPTMKIALVGDKAEKFSQDEIDAAFPNIDPGCTPMGSRVLLQLRSVKTKTKGGIIIGTETKEIEKWNTQVGKVISAGPNAFCSRTTGEAWPEGSWCNTGDYVRIPLFKQDKWTVSRDGEEEVLFMLVNDLDILAKITCNPLEVKAYI